MAARKVALLTFLAAACCAVHAPSTAAWSTAISHKHSPGSTGPAAAHPPGMHIVIAVHQEDVNEVEQYVEKLLGIRSVAATHPRIFIYCKGTPVFVAQARDRGFAHEVIELPNVGREQETYLWHIVAHYDRLPEHVFFSQALANYEELLLGRLQTLFSPRTGALGLGLVAICTCEGYSDLWAGHGPGGFIRLREVWALAQGTLCPHEFACFHNGFLVASRARLHLQPRKLYEYLLGLFATPANHPLRANEELYKHVKSNLPDEWPTWGHVMERSWNALLNCTDVEVAYGCNTPCESEDCSQLERCQCLDDGTPHAGVAPI